MNLRNPTGADIALLIAAFQAYTSQNLAHQRGENCADLVCDLCQRRHRGAWYRREDGGWRHAPWWKVAINSVLRFFQRRGPGRKFVVFTRSTPDGDPPRALGYGFGWVEHL